MDDKASFATSVFCNFEGNVIDVCGCFDFIIKTWWFKAPLGNSMLNYCQHGRRDVTEVLLLPSIRRRTLRGQFLQNGRRQCQCTVGNKEQQTSMHTDLFLKNP
jgi:hypothetical protein